MNVISVIIPTHNSAAYLSEAICGVLGQTFQDFELIVVDDGSTDNTQEVVGLFGERIRYISQDRAGPSTARNHGILESSGDLIAFLDADDVWLPTKLAKQVDFLKQHPEAVLVYTDYNRSSEPGSSNESRLKVFKPRTAEDSFHQLLDENFIATSSVMVRREALANSGLFDPGLRGSEDFDLWLRLARTGRFAFLDEVLVFARQHSGNTSRTVEFIRHQIRAARLMLTRWGDDPVAARLLRRRLGVCSWNLAYAERLAGKYSEARSAYWASARFGHQRVSALARAALCALPRSFVTTVKNGADCSRDSDLLSRSPSGIEEPRTGSQSLPTLPGAQF
jgi:glycosyltransferase involved in cell wall biosynthesis